MARHFGKAGASARQAARGRYLKVCLYAALLLAAPIILQFRTSSLGEFSGLAGTVTALCLVVVLRLLLGFLRGEAAQTARQAKDAARDAQAEQLVAAQLQGLPAAWFAFHDVPFNGFSIDHLVVGPAGVFVLAANSASGMVHVDEDGLRLNGEVPCADFLGEVLSHTTNLREYLWKMTSREWPITPLVCFTDAQVAVVGPISGVLVVGFKDLCAVFQRQPARLGTAAIEQVVRVLKLRLKRQ